MCNANVMTGVEVAASGALAVASGGTSVPLEMSALSMGVGAAETYAQSQQAKRNAALIESQEKLQQNQISQSASVNAGKNAMEGRAARATGAVMASAQGINLGSNSFLGAMQGSDESQDQNEGLIAENLNNQRQASVAQANSELASKASSPTALGGFMDAALKAGSAYVQGNAWAGRGLPAFGGVTGGPPTIADNNDGVSSDGGMVA